MTRLESALEVLIDEIAERVAERVAQKLERSLAGSGAALITVAEYARARSISPSTVRSAIRDGRLDMVRVGRAVRVPTGATIRPRSSAGDRASASSTAMDRALRILGGGAR